MAYLWDGSEEDKAKATLINSEKLCLLLERMELSRGFLNFAQKTHRPHTSKMSLLPN
jgi:hypothetical protein